MTASKRRAALPAGGAEGGKFFEETSATRMERGLPPSPYNATANDASHQIKRTRGDPRWPRRRKEIYGGSGLVTVLVDRRRPEVFHLARAATPLL